MESGEKDEDLEARVLKLIADYKNGMPSKLLQQSLPSTSANELVELLNKLTSADKIQIMKQGEQLKYKLKVPDKNRNSKGDDLEERIIYNIIENAGNKGIWIRDLRHASNLSQVQVNKICKSLESKRKIKSVQSIAAAKKKVYMLYDLVPDRSVSGGTWYSGNEFESEFVEVLTQQCYKYLLKAKADADRKEEAVLKRNGSFKTSEDICNFINSLQVSKVQLSIQDIESILDTLVYDDKVEKAVLTGSAGNRNIYRAIKPLISSCGLMRVPCGVCPVHNECSETGVISPSTCVYMKEWLQF